MVLWLIVLLASWLTQGSEPHVRRTNYHHSLIQVSRTLDQVRDLLKAQKNKKSIYLIGGTSRAILDHLIFSTPLKLKDIDIGISIERPVKKHEVERLSQALEDADISRLKAF